MRLVTLAPAFTLALGLGLGTIGAACGGSPQPPTTPAPDGSAAPAASSAAPAASASAAPAASATPAPAASASAAPATNDAPKWATMTKEQKVEHMKTAVVPPLGKVFQEADAKKYKNFGCATCHGAKPKDPHEHLPKITLSNGGYEKLAKAKPEVMKLMSEKVVPAMATAMGEKPYDPATKQGFGCAGCHTVN